MKNKILILFASVFILFPSNSFAQSKWKPEIRGGWNTLTSGPLFANWGNGWDAGAGFSYQLTPILQLATNAAYQYFPYKGGHVFYVVPAVLGINSSVEGEKSYAYEASLTARLNTAKSKFSPFISLSSGIYYINIGQINVKIWMGAIPQESDIYPYAGTGKTEIKGFGSFRLGFNIPITSLWTIRLESGYTSTFDGNQQYLPVLSTIQFNL